MTSINECAQTMLYTGLNMIVENWARSFVEEYDGIDAKELTEHFKTF